MDGRGGARWGAARFATAWTHPQSSPGRSGDVPRRIAALDPSRITEWLLALGVVPVGSTTVEDLHTLRRGLWPPALHGHVPPEVVDLGWYADPPDLDRLRAVRPDLILTLGDGVARHSEGRWLRESGLGTVAPTVVLPDRRCPQDRPAFIDRLRTLAQLTDRQHRGEVLLAGYEGRRAVLAPLVVGERVAAVWLRPGHVALYTRQHPSQVLTDVGIDLEDPGAEADPAAGDLAPSRVLGPGGFAALAAPFMVFTPSFVDPGRLSGFLAQPDWAAHPTVAGNAHMLGWSLAHSGYFSAHAQLDAIERLLGISTCAVRVGPSLIRIGFRPTRHLLTWSVQGPALHGELWIGAHRGVVLDLTTRVGGCQLLGVTDGAALTTGRGWVRDRDGLREVPMVPDSVTLALQP